MNRSKRDKWSPHEPTRFVFVLRRHRLERPWQGFVIEFREKRRGWEALVTYRDDEADGQPFVCRWIPTDQLRPVRVDPNPSRDEWF